VNNSIFLAASLILLLSPLSAHAQAAAESALTNALSSSATVKAGSSLGSALNQGAARMGVRVQENTARSPRLGLQQNSTSTHLTTQVRTSQSGMNQIRPSQPSNNLHIGSTPTTGGLSIRGGQLICSPDGSSNQPAKGHTGSGTTGCQSRGNPANDVNEDPYKSFVTIPPPK
jgi:hypothetical protein